MRIDLKIKRILNAALRRVGRSFYTIVRDVTLRMVFKDEITEWNPDVVHSHDGITLPLASEVATACGAKLVFDSHELEIHRNPPLSRIGRLQVKYIERTYLPKVDLTITVGNKIADYLANEYPIRRPAVIYNAPRVTPTPVAERWGTPDKQDLRDDLQVRNGAFVLVQVGNITFNRGLEQAVVGLSKAADDPTFRQRYPAGIHLALLGRTVPDVVAEINRLHALYGKIIAIHYLPPVAPNRVVDYIKSADAGLSSVLPVALSYEYAMPNKLFESVIAGLPILASDIVEMKGFIAEHKLGVCYQADDTNRLAEAFLELSMNINRYKRSEGRQTQLEAKFSWEQQERTLLSNYRALFRDDVLVSDITNERVAHVLQS